MVHRGRIFQKELQFQEKGNNWGYGNLNAFIVSLMVLDWNYVKDMILVILELRKRVMQLISCPLRK